MVVSVIAVGTVSSGSGCAYHGFSSARGSRWEEGSRGAANSGETTEVRSTAAPPEPACRPRGARGPPASARRQPPTSPHMPMLAGSPSEHTALRAMEVAHVRPTRRQRCEHWGVGDVSPDYKWTEGEIGMPFGNTPGHALWTRTRNAHSGRALPAYTPGTSSGHALRACTGHGLGIRVQSALPECMARERPRSARTKCAPGVS